MSLSALVFDLVPDNVAESYSILILSALNPLGLVHHNAEHVVFNDSGRA